MPTGPTPMPRTWRRWLHGVIWLLAAPTLVLVAFAVLTWGLNSRPQAGQVRVRVEPQWVLPWQDAKLRIDVAPPRVEEPPGPVDLALLVDVSGSMGGYRDQMAVAVRELAEAMAQGAAGTRFSLVRFDTEAQILVPWTADREELSRGVQKLQPITGGNSAGAVFARLEDLMADRRRQARLVVVWFTDGYLDVCPGFACPGRLTYDEIAERAVEMRRQGAEVFAVAPSSVLSPPHGVLERMTGPGRVLPAADASSVARSFRIVAAEVLSGERAQASLEQRLDGRHFVAVLEEDGWQPVADDAVALPVLRIVGRPSHQVLTVEPQSMGWWKVGLEPARLTAAGAAGTGPQEERAQRRPRLLVVTWWTLLWLLAPALAWGALHRPLPSTGDESVPPALPPVRRPVVADRLPPVPPPRLPSFRAVPTLFVGVGGRAGRALEAIRVELAGLHGDARGPYRFLAFDVDRRSPRPPVAVSSQAEVETSVAPPEVTDVVAYLPPPGRRPDAWSWLDAERYADASREALDLAGGAQGDRVLGRLALFRWLEEGELLAALRRAVADLVGRDPAAGVAQIVVIADADGGFGSGTFVDWGRLLRRLGRQLQAEDVATRMPRVVGLLLTGAGLPEVNRLSLLFELESAQAAGAHPHATGYGAGPDLERVDGEPAFEAVLELRAADDEAGIDQAAQSASLLAERAVQASCLEAIHSLRAAAPDVAPTVRTQIRTLELQPGLQRRRRRFDLMTRFLGPDLLLDAVPDADGAIQPPALTPSDVDERLRRWVAEEPADTPLAMVLVACLGGDDGTTAPRSLEAVSGDVLEVWLCDALEAGLARHLHGRRAGTGWVRGWMPGEAVTVLRGLARRLDRLTGFGDGVAAAVAALSAAASAAAEALLGWLQEAGAGVVRWQGRQEVLEDELRRRGALHGRTTLRMQKVAEEDVSSGEARSLLAAWLGGQDTVSALRRHLFVAPRRDGEAWRVEVRDHLEDARVHATWSAVESRLESLAARLAASRPVEPLAQVLAELPEARLEAAAESLVDLQERSEATLLVVPRAVPGSASERAVSDLSERIPQPADHGGPRREVRSADPARIRRVSLSLPSFDRRRPDFGAVGSRFAATPEQEAERSRRRLQSLHRRDLPPFPVALRIASARPGVFAIFARAFASGRIALRRDAAGRQQWYSLERRRFLTFGDDADLAAAAASFVLQADTEPPEGVDAEAGDKAAERPAELDSVEARLAEPGPADDELLTLAVIDAVTRRQA